MHAVPFVVRYEELEFKHGMMQISYQRGEGGVLYEQIGLVQ